MVLNKLTSKVVLRPYRKFAIASCVKKLNLKIKQQQKNCVSCVISKLV